MNKEKKKKVLYQDSDEVSINCVAYHHDKKNKYFGDNNNWYFFSYLFKTTISNHMTYVQFVCQNSEKSFQYIMNVIYI